MFDTDRQLMQPLAYRVWDPARKVFFFTDGQPAPSLLVDRWSGFFDKEGRPLYERDIIRVHYNWQLGWVRAAVVRDADRSQFAAEGVGPAGEVLRVGFYSFAEGYKVGNLRQHPAKLTRAREQFPDLNVEPWWLSPRIFPSGAISAAN